MNLEKLTPAPWKLADWPESDKYPEIIRGDGSALTVALHGMDSCIDGRLDAEFIALARNAFEVMMRRGWGVRFIFLWRNVDPPPPKTWVVCGLRGELIGPSGKELIHAADPFTALVETDKWYREHVESVLGVNS